MLCWLSNDFFSNKFCGYCPKSRPAENRFSTVAGIVLEKFEKSLNPAVRIQKLYHAKIEATTSWHTVYILFGKAAIREGSVKLDLYIK